MECATRREWAGVGILLNFLIPIIQFSAKRIREAKTYFERKKVKSWDGQMYLRKARIGFRDKICPQRLVAVERKDGHVYRRWD